MEATKTGQKDAHRSCFYEHTDATIAANTRRVLQSSFAWINRIHSQYVGTARSAPTAYAVRLRAPVMDAKRKKFRRHTTARAHHLSPSANLRNIRQASERLPQARPAASSIDR